MADENPEIPELASFDPTKKKKKKKPVIQDSVEELESLSVTEPGEPSFVGLKKKKKKKHVQIDDPVEEEGDGGEEFDGEAFGVDEEAEGIFVGGVTSLPWEGSDRDYHYQEVLTGDRI